MALSVLTTTLQMLMELSPPAMSIHSLYSLDPCSYATDAYDHRANDVVVQKGGDGGHDEVWFHREDGLFPFGGQGLSLEAER